VISFSSFYQQIADSNLQHWLETLPSILGKWQRDHKHGNLPKWEKVLNKLHYPAPDQVDFVDSVTVGSGEQLSSGEKEKLENLLRLFMPWRKGPFHIHGIHIDTEWRSDIKWNRIRPHLAPLAGQSILDIGCGSGYHLWRMAADQPARVIGIDPMALFSMQFAIFKQHLTDVPAYFLPVGIERMPAQMQCFDSVFSMGVLYHRHSPIDHLRQLHQLLKSKGQLILETLILQGPTDACLIPQGRYAKMRNVWFIPSVSLMQTCLKRCGFENIRCVDVSPTTSQEQRSTSWMYFESLSDFLDPHDPGKTIEGHPAPVRATFIATTK